MVQTQRSIDLQGLRGSKTGSQPSRRTGHDVMFLELFHGRPDPNQEMDDWGEPGPIFECPNYVHTTYACDIKLGEIGGHWCDLKIVDGMIYYSGMWYGDWSVFIPDEKTRRSADFLNRLTPFDPVKAILPSHSAAKQTYTVVGLFPPDPDWDSSPWDASFVEQAMAGTPKEAGRSACLKVASKRLIGRDVNGGEPTDDEIQAMAKKIEILAVFEGNLHDCHNRKASGRT